MSACSGKRGRLSRIVNSTFNRAMILALDHGLTLGPAPGLERIADRFRGVSRDAIDAFVVHQGMVSRLMPLFESAQRPGLIVHLSGATQLSPDANEKRLVCTVEHALRLGADGVSVHANLGVRAENQMLADLARVSEACHQWGVPLLAMMYPRRENQATPIEPKHVAHAIRIAMELGVDLIKVPYTGSRASFACALEDVDVPVFVAGGARPGTEEEVLQLVDDVLQAGAAGVTFGRNIFQSARPLRLARVVSAMIHRRLGLDQALALLNPQDEELSGTRPLSFPREERNTGVFPASLGSLSVALPASR